MYIYQCFSIYSIIFIVKYRFCDIFFGFSIKSDIAYRFFTVYFNDMSIDTTDIEILKLLQNDASLTNKEISHRLHKSVAAIHERIRRLYEQGYIKKTVALLNRKKINCNLIAYIHVLLNDHAAGTLSAFEEQVVKFPEVMECYQMTGTFDFLLRVAIADMDAYQDFYRKKMAALPNITTVQSFFVMSETKSDTAYPL